MGARQGARPDPTTPLAGRTQDEVAASRSRKLRFGPASCSRLALACLIFCGCVPQEAAASVLSRRAPVAAGSATLPEAMALTDAAGLAAVPFVAGSRTQVIRLSASAGVPGSKNYTRGMNE